MYFWNGIKQRWQKVGCVAFSQNDNKRLILGSLKRRRQRKLQNNSNRFRPRQHVFVFVWKTEKSVVIYSCTWENRSGHGLGKWYAKFRTGNFRPRIAFTICTNQFHLPKNGREGLKPRSHVWAWGIEMKHEFPFGTFRPEKQYYLFRWSGAPGNFPLQRPNVVFHLLFQPDFPELFVNDKLLFSPVWPAPTVHTYPLKMSPTMHCRVFTDKLAS